MNAPALMHGTDWTGQDVAGWLASEKFNGWRCVWTGAQLLTRSGNALAAPDWFTAGLPLTPLDCELHLGRGHTNNDVHRAIARVEWHRLKLAAFDVPKPGIAIEAAIQLLESLRLPAHVAPVAYRHVETTAEAFTLRDAICRARGEGVMLRKPATRYETFRTDNLLKLKP